eukprot:s520_g17.t1
MLLLSFTGGAGLVEHPEEPDDPAAASIWRLPLMKLLLNLPGFEKQSLAQGLFGASSAKRTGLLTLNFPQSLRKFFVCADLPMGRSIGLDSAGCFKTADLLADGNAAKLPM